MKGILVIGHGSRVIEVNETFKTLIGMLRENTGIDVFGGNLIIAKPSVEEAIDIMYEKGIRKIVVIPYLLSNGAHVTTHIPGILKDKREEYGNLEFQLEDSLRLNPLVVKAMEEKILKNI